MNAEHYDIVGDIHGYAEPLEAMLMEIACTSHPRVTGLTIDTAASGRENIFQTLNGEAHEHP